MASQTMQHNLYTKYVLSMFVLCCHESLPFPPFFSHLFPWLFQDLPTDQAIIIKIAAGFLQQYVLKGLPCSCRDLYALWHDQGFARLCKGCHHQFGKMVDVPIQLNQLGQWDSAASLQAIPNKRVLPGLLHLPSLLRGIASKRAATVGVLLPTSTATVDSHLAR